MPDTSIEHDTIEDARVAKDEPLVGKATPDEPEPGTIKQIRMAMRDKMLRQRYGTSENRGPDDDPWLTVENEAIWTVHK